MAQVAQLRDVSPWSAQLSGPFTYVGATPPLLLCAVSVAIFLNALIVSAFQIVVNNMFPLCDCEEGST
jgi:hypothetical protein